MSAEYNFKLAEWKLKHGLNPHINESPDEIRMIAEELASKKTAWCFECDKEMPVREMVLITRRIDPYLQTDENEGDYIAKDERTRMCKTCFKEHYG